MTTVVLSNPLVPSYGVVTIPMPIPNEEYDNCINLLKAIEVGDAKAYDCKLEELNGDCLYLSPLIGKSVNVDELDYLIKRLESFDSRELAKYGALSVSQNIQTMKDFINLTFCCQDSPIIINFADLSGEGKSSYLSRNYGVTSDEFDKIDGLSQALQMIHTEKGKVTPFGVIYDEGFEMEQLYQGRQFPRYQYEDCIMEIELTNAKLPYTEQTGTYLYLPMSELWVERAIERGELCNKEISMRFFDIELPHHAIPVIDFEGENIQDINILCQEVNGMDKSDRLKLDAAIQLVKPNNAAEITNLARQLDLFDFAPCVLTPTDYGKYMIIESGRFEYDENLEEYYDFAKYGNQRIANEGGEFVVGGYISYQGFVSVEEMLAGVSSERMEQEMGGIQL